jgi:hypothetical protein
MLPIKSEVYFCKKFEPLVKYLSSSFPPKWVLYFEKKTLKIQAVVKISLKK